MGVTSPLSLTSHREGAQRKGRRYLVEGRLVVTSVVGNNVRAVCRGQGVLHHVGHDDARGWWCDCEARTTCSHLVALQLVVVRRDHADHAGAVGWSA
jgi:uncharacterized Zn finger protein